MGCGDDNAMNLQPTCAKCGADLTVDTMKALPDGKGFVCLDCYDAQGPRLTRSGFVDINKPKEPLRTSQHREQISSSTATHQSTINSDNFFELKEYVCHNCGYSFKKAPEFEVRLCPYCGKKDTVYQSVSSGADDFLA
jgi:DNA-directed RNA polymerase subunit RPC12/RpoP